MVWCEDDEGPTMRPTKQQRVDGGTPDQENGGNSAESQAERQAAEIGGQQYIINIIL